MNLRKLRLPAIGEVGIAGLVVAIVSLMVLPLPTEAIDALVAVNITLSVTVLMTTLYAQDLIALSTFPSMLLFTTLYRLSLNIASTKAILLHANAGHIIESFGELVVGGNLVVGLVVFVTIAVVQFIVIAKGSERVAEVGARFTLDGMPGKQMSIDAELRSNALTPEEARRKRTHLAMESQLHGGMDGAMKFVKGDAIAGLIITLINILAGIAVGVAYHGMTAGEAANRFSILSVGDAMVSQIPSLLISVAAGVMITRVSNDLDERKDKSLGNEILRQLGGQARPLYFASLLLIGFSLVPGFPKLLFVLLAGILAFSGYRLSKKSTTRSETKASDAVAAFQRAGAKGEAPAIMTKAPQFAAPIGVRLAPDLVAHLSAQRLNDAFDVCRTRLQDELGLPFPGITMWSSPELPAATYEVLIHDVPGARVALPAGKVMLPDAAREPDLAARCEAHGPAGGALESFWIGENAAPAKATVWRAEDVIAHETIALLRMRAQQFLGIQETQWMLDQLNVDYPGLVTEVTKAVPLQKIADVLRRLLEEQISIRNVRGIMESLVLWGPKEKDPLLLAEYVRGDLAPYLAHRAAGAQRALAAVVLDMPVEQHIRQAIRQTPTGNFLALPPEEMQYFVDSIAAHAGDTPREAFAVVASMDIRRYVRRMIESRLAWLPVYSYQELGGHVQMQPVGRVTM
ncbi:type III secretion system export apparatus subunit SctV [Trinickia soli]|uniref:EscV/YscV/HrcV family type III secretion system export apparatus protein n=1 Tax=Trinickia soli TaxID=380675 RepID=A0A2N7VHF9_9BURK|nr:type III secretion system export apparatus subunit SctV [Trinickia soli]KAA0080336.1 EscV/YscV/HrcV family type III secretion system export apparatus protein [Paraburkholderia sp. T12-10]PMS16593.1 EscV/YscV/HrcV family type III secretion system export apparatus protein [Trinickia soli]CAB3676937.1 Protein MxiA [Trinickia soli]